MYRRGNRYSYYASDVFWEHHQLSVSRMQFQFAELNVFVKPRVTMAQYFLKPLLQHLLSMTVLAEFTTTHTASIVDIKVTMAQNFLEPLFQHLLSMVVLAVSTSTRNASIVNFAFRKQYWQPDRLWALLQNVFHRIQHRDGPIG